MPASFIVSAAVMAAFGGLSTGDAEWMVALHRLEGATEKRIVNHVALAVLSPNDPLAAPNMAEAVVCCDGSVGSGLVGVYYQWP